MAGFSSDNFEGNLFHGLYMGQVVNNMDPEKLSRVRVRVPGLIDTESNWALPKGGGSEKWGKNCVAPNGCDVYVQFVNGRIDQPVWEPGPHGRGEQFPEHVPPLVSAMGFGPFRLIVDQREGENTATFAAVMTNPATGDEEQVASIQFDADNLSIKIEAIGVVQVNGQSLTDIDSSGDVQIKGRKVGYANRPIN